MHNHLARRAVVGSEQDDLEWRAHGAYLFKGLDGPMEIFEVGVPGTAPFSQPTGAEKAKRIVTPDEEATLGWRPAVGLPVPGRDHWVLEGLADELVGALGQHMLGATADVAHDTVADEYNVALAWNLSASGQGVGYQPRLMPEQAEHAASLPDSPQWVRNRRPWE